MLHPGRGALCILAPRTGAATDVAPCQGHARGPGFVGRHAAAVTPAMCGLQIVDIDSGRTLHRLCWKRTLRERDDVAILPGIRQAETISFLGADIERHVTMASA